MAPTYHRTEATVPGLSAADERFHALDALRAFALLLGVLLHSTMPFVAPAGVWAVGTARPSLIPSWLSFYLHTFRLEIFFLLSGFFGALVIERRGARAYAVDRLKRVVLVFVVFLYPMKFVLTALWMAGGLKTGWLPPSTETHAWLGLTLQALRLEAWPAIVLTHLWFLYYLACISGLFLSMRALARRSRAGWRRTARGAERLAGTLAGPLLLVLLVTPLVAAMKGGDIDTPDRSFALNLPVLGLYLGFYALGYWLFDHRGPLQPALRHWPLLLALGFGASWLAAIGVGARNMGGAWATEHATSLRWATSFAIGVTTIASVFGWMGLFLRHLARPSRPWRYLADGSYWIYVMHLPVLVALEVWWAPWGLDWVVEIPLLHVALLALLVPSYHYAVRGTWVGAWLNGRRLPP